MTQDTTGADGYYDEESLGDDEIDLSFLDKDDTEE
jgi:hypothetical protein